MHVMFEAKQLEAHPSIVSSQIVLFSPSPGHKIVFRVLEKLPTYNNSARTFECKLGLGAVREYCNSLWGNEVWQLRS